MGDSLEVVNPSYVFPDEEGGTDLFLSGLPCSFHSLVMRNHQSEQSRRNSD